MEQAAVEPRTNAREGGDADYLKKEQVIIKTGISKCHGDVFVKK